MFARTILSAAIIGIAAMALAATSVAAGEQPGSGTRTITINAPGDGPASERIVLGLNKSVVVNLPRDAADVMVSNPEIVDAVIRTPRRIYLLGRSIGQTNAFFFSESGKQILNVEIRVERDAVDLENEVAAIAPDSDISVDLVNDNVVLRGTAGSAVDATAAASAAGRFVGSSERVLNNLAISGREQVMLKVRVAEMQRTFAKQFGVDLSAAFNIGNVPVFFGQTNAFSLLGQALSSQSGLQIGDVLGGQSDADGVLRAYERAGFLRTLAEPNLVAISGEAANFLAGGEFPVPVSRDRDGNVTIQFKPFGVGLGFTPVVLDEGRISLRISTEVSELTTDGAFTSQGGRYTDSDGNIVIVSGITIPGLRVRRAETTVELPSGGSLVMAGLLQESTKQNIDGLPGAKDLPVLGPLFRSRDFQNNETELVIIVTPYLVKPVAEKELALPTDGFAPASDAETILLGHLNLVYGDGTKTQPEGRLQGPVGFIME